MSPILGIWASQNYSRYALPLSFESIATTTVGAGGTANVTFSSIPATYTHLQIRYLARSNRATFSSDSLNIQVNADTASNYNYHLLLGDGATTAAYALTTTSYFEIGTLGTTAGTANSFGGGVIDLLDYGNTNKNKTFRSLSGMDNNSGSSQQQGFITVSSGLWRSTSAVTSLKLYPLNGTQFAQYSHFALYGVKGE